MTYSMKVCLSCIIHKISHKAAMSQSISKLAMSIRNINLLFYKCCMLIKYYISCLCVLTYLQDEFFRLKSIDVT